MDESIALGDTGVWYTTAPGVPTYWSDVGGPFTASLLFRVGWSDETILTSGITHVVEHLAMHGEEDPSLRLDLNGSVGPLETSFDATGARDAVLGMLSRVASRLRGLPLERLDHELGIILVEDAGHGPGIRDAYANLRFGANRLGVACHPRAGLHRLTQAEVESWSVMNFTCSNAVLVLNARPPSDWQLTLPTGHHRAQLEPEFLPHTYPAASWSDGEGVAISFLGTNAATMGAGSDVLERCLRRVLRSERGRSYAVMSEMLRISPTTSYVDATADCGSAHGREVADRMWAILEHLASCGPTPEETAQLVDERIRVFHGENPEFAAGWLARLHLQTNAPPDVAALEAERRGLCPDSIAGELASAIPTACLVLPNSGGHPPKAFTPAASAGVSFDGTEFRLRDSPEGRLVLGSEGASLTDDDHLSFIVRWDACEAVLRWPGGTRWMIGSDGTTVCVSARSVWDGGTASVLLDDLAPDRLVIPMPPLDFPNGGFVDFGPDGSHRFVAVDPDQDGWALADLTRAGTDMPTIAPEHDLCSYEINDLVDVVLIRRPNGTSWHESLELRVVGFYADVAIGQVTKATMFAPRVGPGFHIVFAPHHVADGLRMRPREPTLSRIARWRRRSP